MKVVKPKKELLIQSLILLFALFNFSVFFVQPVSASDSEFPEIEVSISDVVYDGQGPGMEYYSASLNIDIDFGTVTPIQDIREIGFDIRLDGATSGTLSPIDLQVCNNNDISVSQPMEDPNLFHIEAKFPNGITDENGCMFNAIAAVALVVDSTDEESQNFNIISDCYDNFKNTLNASVKISNGYIAYSGSTINLNNDYYIEEFGINDCELPLIENEREFDINLVLKNPSPTVLKVDVYFRYSEGTDISSINYGKIWIVHYGNVFHSPTFIPANELNTQLWVGRNLSSITFNDAAISRKSLTQIRVGTLVYNLVNPSTNSSSEFYALGQFNDQFGALSPYNSGYLDVDEFYYESSEYRIANLGLQLEELVSAYPVPSKDFVFIKTNFKLTENLQLNVCNIEGKLMKQVDFSFSGNQDIQLNVKDLPKGVYQVSIADGDKFSNLKILKQ